MGAGQNRSELYTTQKNYSIIGNTKKVNVPMKELTYNVIIQNNLPEEL